MPKIKGIKMCFCTNKVFLFTFLIVSFHIYSWNTYKTTVCCNKIIVLHLRNHSEKEKNIFRNLQLSFGCVQNVSVLSTLWNQGKSVFVKRLFLLNPSNFMLHMHSQTCDFLCLEEAVCWHLASFAEIRQTVNLELYTVRDEESLGNHYGHVFWVSQPSSPKEFFITYWPLIEWRNKVHWDLYLENISLWRTGEDGVWYFSSVQSAITWVSGKSLK